MRAACPSLLASLTTIAVVATSACGGKKPAPPGGYRSLAACGLAYQLPDGWTATDPSPAPTYTFPAIGPKPAVAELAAPGGMTVVVQCVTTWTKATTTTCDGATTAVGFDDYVARCHDFYRAGPLASEARQDELALRDGDALTLTTARIARGLVDGADATMGFGAVRIGDRHVVVRASAPPAGFDAAGLATFVASLGAT